MILDIGSPGTLSLDRYQPGAAHHREMAAGTTHHLLVIMVLPPSCFPCPRILLSMIDQSQLRLRYAQRLEMPGIFPKLLCARCLSEVLLRTAVLRAYASISPSFPLSFSFMRSTQYSCFLERFLFLSFSSFFQTPLIHEYAVLLFICNQRCPHTSHNNIN